MLQNAFPIVPRMIGLCILVVFFVIMHKTRELCLQQHVEIRLLHGQGKVKYPLLLNVYAELCNTLLNDSKIPDHKATGIGKAENRLLCSVRTDD